MEACIFKNVAYTLECLWVMPVILASWEAEIWKIMVQGPLA
jgi:hypothetical protein